MKLARWILLPVASIASWYVALFIGLFVLGIAESFCPEDQVVSGTCSAPWWKTLEASIFCFSTGLSAFLVVLTAFFVAPSARAAVAWLAFGIGGVTALFFAMGTSAWGMFASAIVTGFFTAHVPARSRFSIAASYDSSLKALSSHDSETD